MSDPSGTADPPAVEAEPPPIPVLRPRLPEADRLLPYLRRIDATRVYSNWGPLTCEFESRLGRHLRLPSGGVVSASSGTAALVGAILASAGRATDRRPFALMPSFTFVATAAAAVQCGYRPYLVDIDAETWMLDPDRVTDHPVVAEAGVVIVVAPFGRPVPQQPWRAFHEKTGTRVVIDAAAGFEGIAAVPERFLGEAPVVMSFHATKSFATGEGGCVASTDLEAISRAGEALNFGFRTTRDSCSASINGRMSEYHAAVGLAEFDGWTEKSRALRDVADTYRRKLAEVGLSDRLLAAPDVSGCYSLFRCRDRAEAERVEDALRRARVDFRKWYGAGLHRQTYYRDLPREDLPVTETIAPLAIGLPVAPDLPDGAVARVVAALAQGCRASA